MSKSELTAVEDLLVRVLPDPMGFVERVMGELAGRLATSPPAEPAAAPSAERSVFDAALADRNLLLAGALGGCECWGCDPGCTVCAGDGTAGWLPPDPALYAEYVEPAARRMGGPRPTAGPTDPEPDHLTMGGRA